MKSNLHLILKSCRDKTFYFGPSVRHCHDPECNFAVSSLSWYVPIKLTNLLIDMSDLLFWLVGVFRFITNRR